MNLCYPYKINTYFLRRSSPSLYYYEVQHRTKNIDPLKQKNDETLKLIEQDEIYLFSHFPVSI